MSVSLDPATLFQWVSIIFMFGFSVIGSLWAVWKKNETFQQKLNEAIPIVWNAVQQALRKNNNVLPGGKTPLEFALDLLQKFVKLTPAQIEMAKIAIAAYHEAQGAPEPGAVPAGGMSLVAGAVRPMPKMGTTLVSR